MSTVAAMPIVEPADWNERFPAGEARCASLDPVLLVTPNPEDERVIRRMLTEVGYAVLAAPTGERAVRIAARFEGYLSLLLTDLQLPGMSGLTLADFVAARQPDLPALLMLDRASDVEDLEARRQRDMPWVRKPFGVDTFLRGVRSATRCGDAPRLRLVKGNAKSASGSPAQPLRVPAKVLPYSPNRHRL
jgi:CheY-like chemotaxis protein